MLPTPIPIQTSATTQTPITRPPAEGGAETARFVQPPGAADGPDARQGAPRRITPPLPYADWLRMLSGYRDGAAAARSDEAIPPVTDRTPLD